MGILSEGEKNCNIHTTAKLAPSLKREVLFLVVLTIAPSYSY